MLRRIQPEVAWRIVANASCFVVMFVAVVSAQRNPDFQAKVLDEAPGQQSFIDELSLAQILRMRASHNAKSQFVDARSKDEYEMGHIPGAIWFQDLANISEDANIVVYCGGDFCSRAMMVAKEIRASGRSAAVYSGGWKEWRFAMLPTAR